jgi:hypothetical protein
VSGEGAKEAAPEPSTRASCLLVLGLFVTAIGVVVVIVMSLRAGGETLARIPVKDTPLSASFRLEEAKELSLWTDLDVDHGDISTEGMNVNLPHVLDYAITVTRDGAPHAELWCNPFDSNFARTSGSRAPLGEPNSRSYDGLLNRCPLAGPPGDYVVTVRRVWRNRDRRIAFRKTDLLVRAK